MRAVRPQDPFIGSERRHARGHHFAEEIQKPEDASLKDNDEMAGIRHPYCHGIELPKRQLPRVGREGSWIPNSAAVFSISAASPLMMA
jgi:hypothetical protein